MTTINYPTIEIIQGDGKVRRLTDGVTQLEKQTFFGMIYNLTNQPWLVRLTKSYRCRHYTVTEVDGKRWIDYDQQKKEKTKWM